MWVVLQHSMQTPSQPTNPASLYPGTARPVPPVRPENFANNKLQFLTIY